jgi:hypothetical protein
MPPKEALIAQRIGTLPDKERDLGFAEARKNNVLPTFDDLMVPQLRSRTDDGRGLDCQLFYLELISRSPTYGGN